MVRKYGTWNPVRWITRKERTLLAVDRNWKATVLHLENVSASSRDHAAIAKGLLKILKSARFITFLGFMLDFIAVLSKLSCSFQSDSLVLAEVLDEINIAIVSLRALQAWLGQQQQRYEQEFSVTNPTEFKGICITGGKRNGCSKERWSRTGSQCNTAYYSS